MGEHAITMGNAFSPETKSEKNLANLPKQSTDASADCAVQNDYAS